MRLKDKRLNALKKLITEHAIEDQDQLTELLAQKHNISVNQSMISRDLREIGAVKRTRKDRLVYELDTIDATTEILHRAVVSIEYNETMLAVHTLGGLADFVGDYLDNQECKSILATLAGENVIFIMPRSTKQMEKNYLELCKLLQYKEQT